MKAVVLAAGQGLRLRPLTHQLPKAMVELKGKPLLERILRELVSVGIDEIILIVGYHKEKIIDFFGDNFKGVKIDYIVQEEQLGTAHAIGLVKEFVKEDFLVLSGDILTEKDLFRELKKLKGFEAVVTARKSTEPWRYGCLKEKNGILEDIVEKPQKGKQPSNLINLGVYLFSSKIFEAIAKTKKSSRGEYEITESIKELIPGKKVKVLEYRGMCADIGSLEDLKKAEELI